jgi:hypothetical protein
VTAVRAGPRINLFVPVFAFNTTQLKGVLAQGFFLDTFAVTAFEGFDNSTVQLVWRDLTEGAHSAVACCDRSHARAFVAGVLANETVLVEVNTNQTDVGSLSYTTSFTFLGRVFELDFRNIDDGQAMLQNAAILTALLVALIIDVIVTVLFFRNRCVRAA